jgi:hypothetical protein
MYENYFIYHLVREQIDGVILLFVFLLNSWFNGIIICFSYLPHDLRDPRDFSKFFSGFINSILWRHVIPLSYQEDLFVRGS